MVSSRRLAREWALKILYQIDVGKPQPQEALETALEQLRMEFVHRGSRTASGSRAEEICLDALTCDLNDTLPTLRTPLERAVVTSIGRLFTEVPYLQEQRYEKTFRTRSPGFSLSPMTLLTPAPDSLFFPKDVSDGLSAQIAAMTPEELARYNRFIGRARAHLARLLEPELRKTALAFAKELVAAAPAGASAQERNAELHPLREEFNKSAVERWNKVGPMVQKQTGDWLRTASFVHKLVTGVQEQQSALDARISGLSSGWALERQVAVDRNIMRIAAYEMLFMPGIPTGASINEAVELAKKYSTAESGRFVNGVLGALATGVGEKLPPANAEIETEDPNDVIDLPDITDMEDTETP